MDPLSPTTQDREHSVTYAQAQNAVRVLLAAIGEDPDREGLKDTPRRVVNALAEMTAGSMTHPESVLSTTFDVKCDEMVVVKDIAFASLCEHHLLPFTGTADIAYLPGDRVVGLSKLPRLVECFARRLQVQERMTSQIAEAIDRYLTPRGVGVIVRGEHACMSCRGIRKAGSTMLTSAMLGAMRDNAKARSEFLALVG